MKNRKVFNFTGQEAERKEFCPNCEAVVPCTHEAELFVCDICGEDFAKYIVSRYCNVSDVSMTQDVTTPEPPEGAFNNKRSKWKAYVPRWGAPAVNERYLVKLINDWITIATYCLHNGGYWKDDRGQELADGVVSFWKGLEE